MTRLILFLTLAALLAAPAHALSCDDGNPCTIAAADIPCTAGDCDDGDPCTTAPHEQVLELQDEDAARSAELACDDGNACTSSKRRDLPDETASPPRMVAKRNSCDDGNPCTAGRHAHPAPPHHRNC